jgi:hypothetical protein
MSLVGRGNVKAGKKRRLVLGPPWQAPKLGRLPKGRLAPLAAAGALAVRRRLRAVRRTGRLRDNGDVARVHNHALW